MEGVLERVSLLKTGQLNKKTFHILPFLFFVRQKAIKHVIDVIPYPTIVDCLSCPVLFGLAFIDGLSICKTITLYVLNILFVQLRDNNNITFRSQSCFIDVRPFYGINPNVVLSIDHSEMKCLLRGFMVCFCYCL